MIDLSTKTATGVNIEDPAAYTISFDALPASPAFHMVYVTIALTFNSLGDTTRLVQFFFEKGDGSVIYGQTYRELTNRDSNEPNHVVFGPFVLPAGEVLKFFAQSDQADADTDITATLVSNDKQYIDAFRAAETSPTADSHTQRLKAIDDLTQASGGGDLAAALAALTHATYGLAKLLRTGADSDTGKTLSDQLDGVPTVAEMNARTLATASYGTAANQTTLLNRIGAFTGSGVNTILGFFRALMRKDGSITTPSDVGGAYSHTTDSTEALRDRGDGGAWSGAGATNPNMLLDTTVAAITDQTHFTLTAGSDQDNAYQDQIVVLYDANNSDFPSVREGSAYTGATRTVTLDSAPDFTLAEGDGVKIFITQAPAVTVTPLSSTVSAGAVDTNDLTAYQHAAFGPYVWTITDDTAAKSPVNLSGKTVKFSVYAPDDSDTQLWTITGAVSGDDSNIVTISQDDTNTGTAGLFSYRLVNTTDDTELNRGSLTIEPGPDVT